MSGRPTSTARIVALAGRPVTGAVRVARDVERRARRAAADALIASLDAWLSSPELERIVAAVADHEGTSRIAARLADSPAADLLVQHAIDHGLLDTALERALQRDQLWRAVDEIARSPAVADAISHQGRSAAGDVVDGVRLGSQRADAWLERLARRVATGRPDGEGAAAGRVAGPPPPRAADHDGPAGA